MKINPAIILTCAMLGASSDRPEVRPPRLGQDPGQLSSDDAPHVCILLSSLLVSSH